MVHVPAASRFTLTPDTVHTLGVLEVKVTARPDVAVAVKSKSASVAKRSVGAAKVIVCAVAEIAVISNDLVTLGDDAYNVPPVSPPVCVAVIVQVPAATTVNIPPVVTVHFAGVFEVYEIAIPDDDVPGSWNGAVVLPGEKFAVIVPNSNVTVCGVPCDILST